MTACRPRPTGTPGAGDPGQRLTRQRLAIEQCEQALWRDGFRADLLPEYQRLNRELEQLLDAQAHDPRRPFLLIVPVADRPLQLRACLSSLLQLCRLYGYGGVRQGRYRKIRVLIADDSGDPHCIAANRSLAAEFSGQGLFCQHFDQTRQRAEIDRLPVDQLALLARCLGVTPRATGAFHHKGPSVMRNIAYLRALRLSREQPDLLCYFIDSDQEFRVKVHTGQGYREYYAINYFARLDQLFRERPIDVLTGKVVGDPPVSPAVMAGNFLDDIDGFLSSIAALDPQQPCAFHGQAGTAVDSDAAYHDMAGLFGFQTWRQTYDFVCPLEGAHRNRDCLAAFAERLPRFFFGEHPTRVSAYRHQPLIDSLQPARTIYTGNYLCNRQGLAYFIPFSALRLRMAGPVLGRILRARLGGRFVSANLPMLHRRTLADSARAEFRPGVAEQREQIDLSGEFDRQFFGDVMLFGMEKLTALGYPSSLPEHSRIVELVAATAHELAGHYRAKQRQILDRSRHLRALCDKPPAHWRPLPETAAAYAALHRFLDNIEHNFAEGAAGYRQIFDEDARHHRLLRMIDAIAGYPQDWRHWQQLLAADD
jgi:hypothetical protein